MDEENLERIRNGEIKDLSGADPEQVVGHIMVDGYNVPVNAYGNVPNSIHKKTLDELEELKAKLVETQVLFLKEALMCYEFAKRYYSTVELRSTKTA